MKKLISSPTCYSSTSDYVIFLNESCYIVHVRWKNKYKEKWKNGKREKNNKKQIDKFTF